MKIGFKSFNKLVSYFWLMIANLPMPGHWRWKVVKRAGIHFNVPEQGRLFVFIGKNVQFDSMFPEDIYIGNHVHLTTNCLLLTHYLDTKSGGVKWEHGKIVIEDGVFIGAGTIITKPCTIGERSIVGAGSIVTKDIPPYEMWAGNPAKFIKKVEKK